jgi:dienelactone hydrolase
LIDTIGYACRLIARYWTILALVLLLLALMALWLTQARWSERVTPAIPFALLALAVAALALPTLRAMTQFMAAFQGAPTTPLLAGAHAVTVFDIALPPSGGQSGLTVRLWRPSNSAGALSRRGCEEAFTQAPPTALNTAPLVLYAPGWGGDRSENARTATMLASHGYIVVALDDSAPQIQFDFSSEAATAETTRRAGERLQLALRDSLYALDQIQACLSAHPVWREKTNFNRVGYLGFSFGGAVAAEASLRDTRIAAVANLDGGLYAQAAEQGARRPYLVVSSDFDLPSARRLASSRRYEWQALYDGVRNEAAHTRRLGGDTLLIRGAPHDAFLDAYGSGDRFKRWLLLPSARAEEIKHALLLDFFETHLRRAISVAAYARYPEVMTFSQMSSRLERIANAP